MFRIIDRIEIVGLEKKSEKNGLYVALDVGAVWLERALAGK